MKQMPEINIIMPPKDMVENVNVFRPYMFIRLFEGLKTAFSAEIIKRDLRLFQESIMYGGLHRQSMLD